MDCLIAFIGYKAIKFVLCIMNSKLHAIIIMWYIICIIKESLRYFQIICKVKKTVSRV